MVVVPGRFLFRVMELEISQVHGLLCVVAFNKYNAHIVSSMAQHSCRGLRGMHRRYRIKTVEGAYDKTLFIVDACYIFASVLEIIC